MLALAFLLGAGLVAAAIGLTPLRRAPVWRAMTAPLASIIGSGFLVSAPLLAREIGGLAILGIAGLCLAGYWIGGAIRFNIAHVEPMLAGREPPRLVRVLERSSDFALVFAYVVSVAYYLALLGAFAVRAVLGAPYAEPARLVATALLAVIGWLGWSGGLRKILSVEMLVVGIKLAIIGGFLLALAAHLAGALAAGAPVAPPPPHGDAGSIPVLLGLLILVQGFETSRFLGEGFDRETRIRSMRLAQILASAIYLAFFALMSPLLATAMAGKGETAIIDAAAVLGPLLLLALTVGALASQFSAAVADAVGCAGLASDAGGRRIGMRYAFPVIAFVSALVLWDTDIYGVITLASRAFAVYYMLQCLVAAAATVRLAGWTRAAAWRLILAVFCAAVAILGVPASA
jgi:hypothetical protein